MSKNNISKDFELKRAKIFLQLSMNRFIDITWSSVSEKLDSAFAGGVYSSNYPLINYGKCIRKTVFSYDSPFTLSSFAIWTLKLPFGLKEFQYAQEADINKIKVAQCITVIIEDWISAHGLNLQLRDIVKFETFQLLISKGKEKLNTLKINLCYYLYLQKNKSKRKVLFSLL